MAVANLHYITRMSSGFKVYILEGHPSLRTEDRYRHITNERPHMPLAHPVKRKHSPEQGLIGGERQGKGRRLPLALTSRERASFKSAYYQRQSSLSPPQCPTLIHRKPTGTSTIWDAPSRPPVFHGPPMDEPLALIKKPRRDQGDRAPCVTGGQIQVRPSVITCVSTSRPMHRPQESQCHHKPVAPAPPACHHVEEHFRRSLGMDYHKTRPHPLSVSVSVDDHFAKALGEKWLQLKASSSSSCSSSSSPPCSPSSSLSPCSHEGLSKESEGLATPHSSSSSSSPVD